MTVLTGFVRGFVEMFAVRMAVGVGEAGCVPASHSLIGDLYPGERRAFAISMFQAGGALGLSVGLAAAGVIADRWGWRAALMATGIAGLPLALIAFTTLREPSRIVSAGAQPAAESVIAAVRALMSRPALVHLTLAISLGAFAIYGLAQWVPAFFVRTHHLSLTQVGLFGGLAGSVASVVGVLLGGAAMLRLGPRDRRWELWWPMIGYGLSGPLYFAVFMSHNWALAFCLQFAAVFSASTGVGVALSAVQSHAEPHRRATAVAIVLTVSSFLGLGVGPVGVGALSDFLAPYVGVDSLRYALMTSTILLLWAGLHFWLAARAATVRLIQP
jgi:MFS family permease